MMLYQRPSRTRRFGKSLTRLPMSMMLVVLAWSLLAPSMHVRRAQAQAWSLTTAQRQAYLSYYAPVILKRGDENDGKAGRDWLTNFDFDQDGNFANNRVNWRTINRYVDAAASGSGSYSHWRIRPTLYTSLIEYMEGSSKSLVLLYHVYNAADKDGSEIHDWERVEIVVRGITGTPGGSGEAVGHVTVTLHKEHHMRRSYDSALNFMQTATGKHVLLWQADESNFDYHSPTATHGHELRFVTNPYSWIAGQSPTASAEVNITNKDEKKNLHYVFVPDGSPAAINAWGARPLSYATAASLASRVDNGNTEDWHQVKRITYELQDLADIFPTHWQNNPWSTHWLASDSEDVLLESPIVNEAGQAEVSTGLQRFYTQSRDNGKAELTDGREGIPDKPWFYGAYSAELNPEVPSGSDDFQGYSGAGLDSSGRSRGAASGYYNAHNAFWWQHDFFVHSGVINDADTREEGMWLTGAWYTAANGGFDGRWVQLFDDRPGYEPVAPLTLTFRYAASTCSSSLHFTASVTGGQAPYTYTWSDGTSITTTSTSGSTILNAYETVSVTVRSADGQTRSGSYTFVPYCPGQDEPPIL